MVTPCLLLLSVSAKGFETGSRIATLETTPSNCYTVRHYDIKGRVTKTISTNHLGGTETVTTTYGHTEKPLTVTHQHTAPGKATQTELLTYTYDQADRLKTVTHKLNGNAAVTLKNNTYDIYGRLRSCYVMNKEAVTYNYNIRNWLTSISSTNFQESLVYVGGLHPRFNGNVAYMNWKVGSESNARAYNFTYDALDRLTMASYSGAGNYTTEYSYDLNGNFTTLKRNGLQDGGTYGLIDNLTFTLSGNQVTRIEDAVNDPTYNGAFNFMDGASQQNEYTYDKNGNLTKDLNKKISSIQYNSLNLPTSITYSNGKSAAYIYDAAGRKLRTSYKTSASATAIPTDYCGNMIYENSVLKQILVDGGYITLNGSTPQYHYYLQDHLGNNRVVVRQDGTIEQLNHYYPFGVLFGESTGGDKNRYKYNGKELDRLNGIDLYDYGARWYNAASIHWTSVDPMCEKCYNTSPYVYCHNNPILRIDPSGAYDFKGLVKNNSYNIAVVITTKYEKNRAMNSDFNAAQKNGIPVILVENISDFANALNSMSQMGISVNTFSINSHGQAAGYNTPANFYIGEENVNINTDFSSLKSGLEGKNVFINACRVGVENNFSIDLSTGQNLIEHIAEQTGSDVFAPSHRVLSGYPFNGSRTLNGPVNQNTPDGPHSEFIHSNKGSLSEIVNNLRISRFLGLEYDDENGWKHNK